MADIKSYRDLVVWNQAMDLATAVYSATRNWPKDELYGLTSQVRRAAASVAANIAEGYGRENRGSLKEMETHLLLSERIGITSREIIQPLLLDSESVGKLLRRLIRKLSEQ